MAKSYMGPDRLKEDIVNFLSPCHVVSELELYLHFYLHFITAPLLNFLYVYASFNNIICLLQFCGLFDNVRNFVK